MRLNADKSIFTFYIEYEGLSMKNKLLYHFSIRTYVAPKFDG